MSDLIPGLTDAQSSAVEMALKMVGDPSRHDGICRAIHDGLGNDGPPWSDAEVMAALIVAMVHFSGVNIPGPLFASDICVKADAQQIHAAKAGLSGNANLKH